MSAPDDRNRVPNAPDAHQANVAALYQELILDHYRRPRNRGKLESPDVALRKKNPLCGDVIDLQVQFDGDTVRDIRFTGEGCAISQAAASMLTQRLKGRSSNEAAQILDRFTRMVHGDAGAADETLGDLRALSGVSRLPVRHPCALLASDALAEALASRR
ncbi:MAG TPA: SUF system NifU family Fe-S cluster assembly protein [Gemmatimonadaceae bacterium]|nr:SUF system NifU family Fe-S cluster assembly protein [Gemmatimonadaceae bacterium]